MAALDFPANPTNGQVYGNWIYNSSKVAWQAKPMVSAKTVTSDVAPSSPANGDEWLNTVDGCLYIYYTDVDGSQWVQVKNDASFSSTLGPRVDTLETFKDIVQFAHSTYSVHTGTGAGGSVTLVSSATFTPKYSTSKIIVIVNINGLSKYIGATTDTYLALKLIKDGSTVVQDIVGTYFNGIAGTSTVNNVGGASTIYQETAGSTAARDFHVRLYGYGPGYVSGNRDATSSMLILEVRP